MTNLENILSNIYYDQKNPASFSSVSKLYRAAKAKNSKITLKFVKDWLSGELTYTLHKNKRNNYSREKIFVTHPNEQFQADLVDMKMFSRQNNGYRFILTVIDCFSKYAFALPLKNKSGSEVKNALQRIIEERKPEKLQTDRGKEFINSSVQNYLKENDIQFFTTFNTLFKCAIVERFNRTLKSKMFKYFTFTGKNRYIDILQDLVNSYNNTVHRTIKLKPIDVTEDDTDFIFFNIYGVSNPREYLLNKFSKPNIKVGDKVRQKYLKTVMDKGYYPNWTDEIFTVTKSIKGKQKPMFNIESLLGDQIQERVYPEEIQKVKENFYRIEKIVKTVTQNGVKGYIVKWLNYPQKYNSFVSERDLVNFNVNRRNT